MSKRPNTSRRPTESGDIPFMGAFHPKSRPSPMLSIGLLIVGALLIVGYIFKGSGGSTDIASLSRLDGGISCTLEVTRLIPFLKKAYGDSMHKVLHVGPETCSVVSQLLKEEDAEAWGVEPYELDDADGNCMRLMHKGIVRVADIKFPLPYRPKSFSLVIVSDALDYLSPKYLNKTVPELARVASDGLVILSGYPGQQRVKVAELSKFGRPAYVFVLWNLSFGPGHLILGRRNILHTQVNLAFGFTYASLCGSASNQLAKLRSSSWWIRLFIQTSLEENETATKKFQQAAAKKSLMSSCQIFHLKPLH